MSRQPVNGRLQRGQSMAEFLVALLALVPLFLAVGYAGRYGDLQQTATQASRYAAFQRVAQPNGKVLTDQKIEDQMRARFFTHWDHHHKDGHLQSDDTATTLKASEGQTWLWRDLGGKALLEKPDQVTLRFGSTSLGSGKVAKALDFMTKTAGKTYGGASVAQVEVTLLNRFDLASDKPAPLVIAAVTAAAGDGLGSSGSPDTRNAAATLVPTSKIPKGLSGFISGAIGLFEPEGPVLGCIKPDVVYQSRLDGAADNSKCM